MKKEFNKKKKIIILDTNALLYDSQIIFAFPQSEVIIPQTVFVELDKLKMTSLDKDLRFRGRKVSRLLFDISEKGKLVEGISLENSSTLRVVSFDPNKPYPSSLNIKSSDDQILATVYQIATDNPQAEVTIVTNDLNMLLKAQLFGIKVQQFRERESRRESISRLLKTKKRSLLPIATGLVLFIALVLIIQFGVLGGNKSKVELPPEIRAEFEAYKVQEQEYLRILRENPNDLQTLIALGNFYFDSHKYQNAIEIYRKAIKLDPANTDVRTDLAIAYFNLGIIDLALAELNKVIKIDPKHAYAHYNLGVVLWRGRNDLKGAEKEFRKYLELEPNGTLSQAAQSNLKKIKAILKSQRS